MRLLIFLLAAFHLWLALGQAAHAGSANVAVTVTGTGPTLELAKSDATRQALQQTISQLVVVDREISGNAVLRDRVLSTMNGYIEKFVVRREIKTGAEFSVTADVVVSASRIENFIGIVASAGGAFDGGSLQAEQARRQAQAQADILQQKARGEIFDNVLRALPSKAISIKTTGITLSDTGPEIIKMKVEITYKPEFIKALTGSVEALSAVKCPPQPRKYILMGMQVDGLEQVASMYGFEDRCRGSRDVQNGGGPGFPGLPGFPGSNMSKPQPVVCFGYTTTIQCYGLAPGDYCASCKLDYRGKSPMAFQVVGRFVDRTWQSAHSHSCGAAYYVPNTFSLNKEYIPAGISNHYVSPFTAIFDLESLTKEIEVSAKGVSLERAKYFVAVGTLVETYASSSPKIMSSVLEGYVDANSGCALLDEAVRMRQLVGFDDAAGTLR